MGIVVKFGRNFPTFPIPFFPLICQEYLWLYSANRSKRQVAVLTHCGVHHEAHVRCGYGNGMTLSATVGFVYKNLSQFSE